ncbi:hypothetical protein [Niallia sp. 03133]|uniref:hypothetical protein n=1 Tax=Niallia sp. 03133 TaxID=3458060 RepID=UPI0040439964
MVGNRWIWYVVFIFTIVLLIYGIVTANIWVSAIAFGISLLLKKYVTAILTSYRK